MRSDQTADDFICSSLRGPSLRSGRHDFLCREVRSIALVVLIGLAACAPASPPPATPPVAGGWHAFQGEWTAVGTRHTIQMGSDRRSSTLNLSGSLLLSGAERPNVGFRSEALVLNDSATGMVGRSVWTDERGDQLFSELRGEGTATGNRIVGRIVGGTGRYSGATGDYEFSWKFVLQAEDGSVQGQAVGLKGRVRTGAPRATPGEVGTRR